MKKLLICISIITTTSFLSAQSGYQEFTTSGSFTVPPDVTSINIEVIGGGGGGNINGYGGGGGGGYSFGTFAVTPGDVIPVTIGLGGASGSSGGTTSVGAFLQATGGATGTWVSHPNIGGGGAGGVGSGGTINYTGGTGGGGYWTYFGGGGGGAAGPDGDGSPGGDAIVWSGNCLFPGATGGASGGFPGGDGGKGAGFQDAGCNVTDPAEPGFNYGGGGGSGNGIGSTPGQGADGYAIITWGDPCPDPTDLLASDIEMDSALLSWTENGEATSWNIEWGISGFTPGTGTTIEVDENPYLLEGLTPDTAYDFYVQAICGGAGNSEWGGPTTFETEEELGTDDNTITGFSFYPNPLQETLTLSATNTLDQVIIYTVLGHQVINQQIGTASTEINVSNLTPGIYLMKVVSGGQTATHRLIKK